MNYAPIKAMAQIISRCACLLKFANCETVVDRVSFSSYFSAILIHENIACKHFDRSDYQRRSYTETIDDSEL